MLIEVFIVIERIKFLPWLPGLPGQKTLKVKFVTKAISKRARSSKMKKAQIKVHFWRKLLKWLNYFWDFMKYCWFFQKMPLKVLFYSTFKKGQKKAKRGQIGESFHFWQTVSKRQNVNPDGSVNRESERFQWVGVKKTS